MRVLANLIVRLVAIGFGLLCAVLTSAIFLSVGLLRDVIGPRFEYETGVNADPMLIAIFSFAGSPLVLQWVLAPAAIIIALAEAFSWRGLLANLALGALVALVAGWRALGGDPSLPSQGSLVVLAGAGFCGGLVYWLIAGRSAGNWRRRPSAR